MPPVTELPLSAPALEAVNTAIEAVLAGHEPYPALVVDGGWDLIVVGHHPVTSLARLFTSSVATAVIERAHTTVAVVPQAPHSS